ncbi:tetratricopeptide repeat protein [Chitinophaga polysaccharea]|uniref:tetratricopeptide repeat protein n=1 Tax=Chitinophaga polysaccharea TaxID=1293035 RepID=UPI001157C51E|nr:tetratricopeptide repeat protein [Chitinophaga polysaccharea]
MIEHYLRISLIKMKPLIFCLLITSLSYGQEQPSLVKEADSHFLRYNYAIAAGLYEKILKKYAPEKRSVKMMERLAACYREINRYELSARWYEEALQHTDAAADDRLFYGDMLKSMGDFEKAREQYKQYSAKNRNDKVTMRLAVYDSLENWLSGYNDVKLVNIKSINSGKSDWGAIQYGNQIVFVSDSLRGNRLDIKNSGKTYGRTKTPFLKLYMMDKGSKDFGYTRDFSGIINNYPYHIGPVCFSKDRNTAYVTVTRSGIARSLKPDGSGLGNHKLELQIFMKKENKWQTPIPFVYNSMECSTGHAYLSPDENILYFASDRAGGIGGIDIWYCEKQPDNTWGIPRNCGPAINTTEDEAFPVVDHEGKLHFSSKGHPGLGGYDLFVSYGDKDHWSAPVNLKAPFNSSADDFFMVHDAEGNGYLSSNRKGGKGDDDIYRFSMPHVSMPPIPLPSLRIPLVLDIYTPKIVCIYLFNKTRNIGWCYSIEPPSRRIEMMLESDTDYVLRANYGNRGDSLLFDTHNVNVKDTLHRSFHAQPNNM